MATEFQCDVFLSHNQADKPRVRRQAERLWAVGLRQNNFGFPPEAALPSAALGSEWGGLERTVLLVPDPSRATSLTATPELTGHDQDLDVALHDA